MGSQALRVSRNASRDRASYCWSRRQLAEEQCMVREHPSVGERCMARERPSCAEGVCWVGDQDDQELAQGEARHVVL